MGSTVTGNEVKETAGGQAIWGLTGLYKDFWLLRSVKLVAIGRF